MLTAAVGSCRGRNNKKSDCGNHARPSAYCHCWDKRIPMTLSELNSCSCGEDNNIREWGWEAPNTNSQSWVVVSDDQKQVTFHPFHSSGTAAVRGDTPLQHNYQYYWEIKMLSVTYGTDITIGVGTDKVNTSEPVFEFISLLGRDAESYGLSFTGEVKHNATSARDLPGFCRGSIIGVRVDMWHGTLEFKLNRKSQGISFFNLRRHGQLFPMACSTAAQSSMRLVHASSWRASLLVDAARVLAAAARPPHLLPPGLRRALQQRYWLTLPTEEGCILDEDVEPMEQDENKVASNIFSEMLPNVFMNGFYVDNVGRDYRVVVWE